MAPGASQRLLAAAAGLLAVAPVVCRAERVAEPSHLVGAEDEEELDVTSALFEKQDLNADGRIDSGEFLKAMRDAAAVQGRGRRADAGVMRWATSLFNRADLDHDGSLEKLEAEVLVYLTGQDLDRMEREPRHEEGAADGAAPGEAEAAAGDAAGMAAEMLEELDADLDGKVSRQEAMRAAHAAAVGAAEEAGADEPSLLESAEEHFDAADLDGDDFLDGAEAEDFVELLGRDASEALVDAARAKWETGRAGDDDAMSDAAADLFDELDDDLDGKLSREELERAEGHVARLAGAVARHFAAGDADGDGALDEEEARRIVGYAATLSEV